MNRPSANTSCDFVLIMRSVQPNHSINENLITSIDKFAENFGLPEKFTVEDNPKSPFYDAEFNKEKLRVGLEKFDIRTNFASFEARGKYNYELHFSAISENSGMIRFRIRDIEYRFAKNWYEISCLFVQLWKPVYAYTAPYWESYGRNELYGQMMRDREFKKYGPDSFAFRTWLSYALAKMIDISELSKLGADVRELSGYGYQIDLLPEPWDADFDVLLEQREKLNAVLSEAGIRGDYAVPYLPIAGPRWGDFLSGKS